RSSFARSQGETMEIGDVIRFILDRRLTKTQAMLRLLPVPNEYIKQLEELTKQLYAPCMVAVLGQVKAGKSSFVNALLGEDLPIVGMNETTATVTYFRYGRTAPQFPVYCFWKRRRVRRTEENLEFLADLQKNDEKALERASQIDHLEYPLEKEILK